MKRLLLTACAAILVGCSHDLTYNGTPNNPPPPPPPPGNATAVTVTDDKYTPVNLTVSVGQTVVWTNMGPSAHTVTADDNSFSAQLAAPVTTPGYPNTGGGVYTRTFAAAGVYPYHCTFHPEMKGTITVTP
jgi:plastocyanin